MTQKKVPGKKVVWIGWMILASAAATAASAPPPAPPASTIAAASTSATAWSPDTTMPPPATAAGVRAGAVTAAVSATHNDQVSWIRAQAIETAAAAFGVQSGMMVRDAQIDAALSAHATAYDRAFDFAGLELSPGVLPPVITEGRNDFSVPSPNVIRADDRLYRIIRPAELVVSTPTWRTYLMLPTGRVALPNGSLLPTTAAERALWNQWAVKGWDEGVAQANRTFRANLAALRRDVLGMVRYKMLYDQGLVSKPLVVTTQLGITGGANEMAIGDRVTTIARKAALDPDAKRWLRAMPITSSQDIPPP